MTTFILIKLAVLILLNLERSAGNLSSTEVSEGQCLSDQELLPLRHVGTNVLPIFPPGNFYVPMASKAAYRMYAEGLLGRPPATEEELAQMQLLLECGPGLITIQNKGFPHLRYPPSFLQLGLSTAVPNLSDLGIKKGRLNADFVQVECVGLTGSRPDGTISFPPPSLQLRTTTDVLFWANEESSVVLIYRCIGDGTKDYKVLSRNSTISANDVTAIKAKVLAAGFSEQNIAYMSYELNNSE